MMILHAVSKLLLGAYGSKTKHFKLISFYVRFVGIVALTCVWLHDSQIQRTCVFSCPIKFRMIKRLSGKCIINLNFIKNLFDLSFSFRYMFKCFLYLIILTDKLKSSLRRIVKRRSGGVTGVGKRRSRMVQREWIENGTKNGW